MIWIILALILFYFILRPAWRVYKAYRDPQKAMEEFLRRNGFAVPADARPAGAPRVPARRRSTPRPATMCVSPTSRPTTKTHPPPLPPRRPPSRSSSRPSTSPGRRSASNSVDLRPYHTRHAASVQAGVRPDVGTRRAAYGMECDLFWNVCRVRLGTDLRRFWRQRDRGVAGLS